METLPTRNLNNMFNFATSTPANGGVTSGIAPSFDSMLSQLANPTASTGVWSSPTSTPATTTAPATSATPSPATTPAAGSSTQPPVPAGAGAATTGAAAVNGNPADTTQNDADGGGGVSVNRIRPATPNQPLSFQFSGTNVTFPPLKASYVDGAAAPQPKFGAGWTAKEGGRYEHTSGSWAQVRERPRISYGNRSGTTRVATSRGPGVKHPDGTITGIWNGKAGMIRPDGSYADLPYGVHRFGGRAIRVLRSSRVFVSTKDGMRGTFDSLGYVRMRGKGNLTVSGGGPGSSGAKNGASHCSAHGGGSAGTTTGGGKPTEPTHTGGGGASADRIHDMINDLLPMVSSLMGSLGLGDIDLGDLDLESADLSALGGGSAQSLGGAGLLGGLFGGFGDDEE